MKCSLSLFALFLVSTLTLAGCEVIADIFKAGVWTGVILVLVVVGVIVWAVSRSRA
ncbi:MAG: phosphatidate cytidylyltransferase [Candidatus Binatia bacterium]